MAKRISQETFDEAVRENIEEFGMTPDAALAEAATQFRSQGVDLATLDLTGGIGVEELVQLWGQVVESVSAAQQTDYAALRRLIDLCSDTATYGPRNQSLFRAKAWFNRLHEMVDVSTDEAILPYVMNLMVVLTKTNIDNRDFFEPNGCKRLCAIIKQYLAFNNADAHADVLLASYRLAAAVSHSENNKSRLFKEGLKDLILHTLTLPDANSTDTVYEVVRTACSAMKGLCTHDDVRRDMSCAMDNGKYFTNGGSVPLLLGLANQFRARPAVAAAALAACRQLVLTEEAVQVVAQHGGMELPLLILSGGSTDVGLIRSVLGLARNMCADDNRKNKLAGDGTLELIVSCIDSDSCNADPWLVEHGIACLAAMSLRFPANSQRIFKCGAVDVVVKCMRKYSDKPVLLRQACLLFRNIAARCPELRDGILDAGAETVLRAAGIDTNCAPEAYGALRDLGCDVQYVKVVDGQVVPAYETFGSAGASTKFRPVYDDRPDFTERIEENAEAPFKGQNNNVGGGFDHDHEHSHSGDCCADA